MALIKASDRKSTRLNSSHDQISYAVFCLKKKKRVKFKKAGVNDTHLPTVNPTVNRDNAAYLGTLNPDTNKIPKHLFQGYLNIYNNSFKAPWTHYSTEAYPNELKLDHAR